MRAVEHAPETRKQRVKDKTERHGCSIDLARGSDREDVAGSDPSAAESNKASGSAGANFEAPAGSTATPMSTQLGALAASLPHGWELREPSQHRSTCFFAEVGHGRLDLRAGPCLSRATPPRGFDPCGGCNIGGASRSVWAVISALACLRVVVVLDSI